MLTIDDIEIKIKKYDSKKNVVIVNLVLFKQLEVRGYTARYTETKYSLLSPVWIVTPPSIKGRNKFWFHIIRFLDTELWGILEKEIIRQTKEYTNNI